MKKLMSMALLLVSMAALMTSGVLAQTTGNGEPGLEETVKKLAGDAAKGYVGPLVSVIGSNMNAGWFHRAPRSVMLGFDLEVGIVVMGTYLKEENRTFKAEGEFRFDMTQSRQLAALSNAPLAYRENVASAINQQMFKVSFRGPTVLGSAKDTFKVSFPGRSVTVNTPIGPQTYTIPTSDINTGVTGVKDLEGWEVLPLPPFAPQVSLGTILGTQFTLRYLPEVETDAGKFKYMGYGIQHNPGVWFGDILPLDLSASFFTQSVTVGSIFEAKATSFGINASKRLGWGFLNLTPYFGYMLEKSSIAVNYDYQYTTPTGSIAKDKISFSLDGENKSRITLGLSIKILLINVNADYNIGTYKSLSAGVMFII